MPLIIIEPLFLIKIPLCVEIESAEDLNLNLKWNPVKRTFIASSRNRDQQNIKKDKDYTGFRAQLKPTQAEKHQKNLAPSPTSATEQMISYSFLADSPQTKHPPKVSTLFRSRKFHVACSQPPGHMVVYPYFPLILPA